MGTESQAWINADNQWNTILDLQIEADGQFRNSWIPSEPDIRNTVWRASMEVLIDWVDEIILGLHELSKDEQDEPIVWHFHDLYKWRMEINGKLGHTCGKELDMAKVTMYYKRATAFHSR